MSAEDGAYRRRKRRFPMITVGLAAAAVIGVGGAGWWTWESGAGERAIRTVKWWAIAATTHAGFAVDEVLVRGRRETSTAQLLDAVQLARGDPIFAFDPDEVRTRIEALPWIQSATVSRQLPSTVTVSLVERTPLAIWQRRGRFALIDHGGHVIETPQIERFNDLLVVVGDDAPSHTAELLRTLAAEPQLMMRVKAAVRIGARRWNLRLDNGVDVQLPEDNAEVAWARLAVYERDNGILERDVQMLDLRLPDRVIVRKGREAESDAPVAGRKT